MEGKKFDQGKAPWDLLPFDAVEQIVRVLEFGAGKYGAYNWSKGMDHSRLFAAAMRHLTSHWRGETLDSETGLPHLAHALCCLLFLQAYQLRGEGRDDRPHVISKDAEETLARLRQIASGRMPLGQ